jgi:hypothetical protein
MAYTLKLGDTSELVFKHGQNEGHCLAILRSACPTFVEGLVKEKHGNTVVRHEPEIKLVENK